VGFQPTIPVFERAKTVHALDRAATVIGDGKIIVLYSMIFMSFHLALLPEIYLNFAEHGVTHK
jgi:hypothetical protein